MGKENNKKMDYALKNLSSHSGPGNSLFLILIVLYVIASFFTPVLSRTPGAVVLFGSSVSISTFTGVLSSLGNICIIFLAVYFGKHGFITALALLIVQFPLNIFNMVRTLNLASLPGLFGNIFALVAVVIIYLNNIQIAKYQERVRMQAMTDTLTGLPNRFACMELMDEYVKHKLGFIFVSVDINNFKGINDTMGYDVGNEVLRTIAARWKSLAESWDTGTSDFVARLGGDDFALIIRGYRAEEDIATTINAYKNELEKKITIDDCDYYLTACFGYSLFPTDAESGSTIFSCADAAMYAVKEHGGSGGILRYSPEVVTTEKTLEVERKIRTALENGGFYVNLQPQFDMNHNLRGFEALARMRDAEGNFVSPGEFIPVAEDTGLIDRVDLAVFKQAATFLADVLSNTSADIILSINISVRHLMKNNFIEEVKDIIENCKVPADHIEVEITESIMIDSAENALERINELKNMGMKIALDDFGTGYSSLSYLNKIPADILKIDKAFIDEINNSLSSKQYVASIISIGNVFDLEVISEGVETDDQLDTLREIGCDYIQGYIWGKPMMPEDAAKIVVA